MPTFITHAVVGAGLSRAVDRPGKDLHFAVVAAKVAALMAIFPDVDILAFIAGIPYWHWAGHRGALHSVAFAIVLASFAFWLVRREFPQAGRREWLIFCAAAVSHGLLDMITDGGLGSAILFPFTKHRFFCAYRPVPVSPGWSGLFSWGFPLFMWEVGLLWPPAIACFVLGTRWPGKVRWPIIFALLVLTAVIWLKRWDLLYGMRLKFFL